MTHSVRALLEENFHLKALLHRNEQYQVLLRLQKNMAVQLVDSLEMDTATHILLDTLKHVEGISAAGLLYRKPLQSSLSLIGHFGFSGEFQILATDIDLDDPEYRFLYEKGQVFCDDSVDLRKTCPVGSTLAVYPVLVESQNRMVMLVLMTRDFSRNSLGFDFLEAASSHMAGLLTRIDQDNIIRKSLAEKEVLLSEIHHRVKNNLAMISSFIALQDELVKDQSARRVLSGLQKKIDSVAILYELLYKKNDSLSSLSLDEYLLLLVKHCIETMAPHPEAVKLEFECESLVVPVDLAIATGLIISELVTNSLKYAFEDRRGTISLAIAKNKKGLDVCYEDSGKSFPEGFCLDSAQGLGELIIKELTEQLNGSLDFCREESRYCFHFPHRDDSMSN